MISARGMASRSTDVSLEEADRMIASAQKGKAVLQVGHAERFNPALVALRPHVRNPVYFEIHRVGEFTARSLDIDVVLDPVTVESVCPTVCIQRTILVGAILVRHVCKRGLWAACIRYDY